jgi:hypothetical protein
VEKTLVGFLVLTRWSQTLIHELRNLYESQLQGDYQEPQEDEERPGY